MAEFDERGAVLNTRTHVVMPVHNRREVTLSGLAHLRQSGVMEWATIVVVDDGSSDGTAAAVQEEFQEVCLLKGDGSLYWTGGIVMGMRYALDRGAQCVVWLNDDSHPLAGAMERVVNFAMRHDCVAAGLGRFVGSDSVLPFFALRRGRFGLQHVLIPADATEPVSVDACRGNLVALPRVVIDRIGYPDASRLPQYGGDTDYTLRAREAGIDCFVLPGALVDEREYSGDWDESWLLTKRPLTEVWQRFGQKQASLYWPARWTYLTRHWGLLRGGFLFLMPYGKLAAISFIRLFASDKWIERIRTRKLSASSADHLSI